MLSKPQSEQIKEANNHSSFIEGNKKIIHRNDKSGTSVENVNSSSRYEINLRSGALGSQLVKRNDAITLNLEGLW